MKTEKVLIEVDVPEGTSLDTDFTLIRVVNGEGWGRTAMYRILDQAAPLAVEPVVWRYRYKENLGYAGWIYRESETLPDALIDVEQLYTQPAVAVPQGVSAEWIRVVRNAAQLCNARAFDLPIDNSASKNMWYQQTDDLNSILDAMLATTRLINEGEASDKMECGKCDGSGLITIFDYDRNGSDADDQPCPECNGDKDDTAELRYEPPAMGLDEAFYVQPATPPEAKVQVGDEGLPEVLHDFTTHRDIWREAITETIRTCDQCCDGVSVSHWNHELKAFDLAMAALDKYFAATPQPTAATEQHANSSHLWRGR